jgi:hypothetical protein
VEGLTRLNAEGNFTSDKTWEDRVEQYEGYADPVRDAARACIEPADDGAVETGDLELTFGRYFQSRGHDGKSMQTIKGVLDDMATLTVSKTRTRTFTDGDGKDTVYRGIKFTERARQKWVPEDAHWDAYGGKPGAEDGADDGDDGHGRVPVVTLEANQGQVEGTIRATVTEQHSDDDASYNWNHQGTLEGETDGVRWKTDNGPALKEGATYDFEDVIVTSHESSRIVHIVPGLTSCTVVDDGSRDDDQDDLDTDGDGELSQEDRLQELRNVIGSKQNRTDLTGASVGVVLDACEDRGIDRGQAEHDLEKLRRDGKVYEPKGGRVTLTSEGE